MNSWYAIFIFGLVTLTIIPDGISSHLVLLLFVDQPSGAAVSAVSSWVPSFFLQLPPTL